MLNICSAQDKQAEEPIKCCLLPTLFAKIFAIITLFIYPCQLPRLFDSSPLLQDHHLRHEIDLQESYRHWTPSHQCGNSATPSYPLPSIVVRQAIEVKSRALTRYFGMRSFPLLGPESHPYGKDTEDRSDTAKDERTDTADAPL